MASRTENGRQLFGYVPSTGMKRTPSGCKSEIHVSGKHALCEKPGHRTPLPASCQSLPVPTARAPQDSVSSRVSRDACQVFSRSRTSCSRPETECRGTASLAFSSPACVHASKSCGLSAERQCYRWDPEVYVHRNVGNTVAPVVPARSHLVKFFSFAFLAFVFVCSSLTFPSDLETLSPSHASALSRFFSIYSPLVSVSATGVRSLSEAHHAKPDQAAMGEEYETFLAWKELLAYGKGHLDAREANGFALYPFPLPVSAVSPVESLMDTGIVDGQAGWMSTPYLPDERSGLSASAEQPAAHEPSIGEDTRQADEEVSAFFSDNHPRLPLGRSRAAQRAGILRFTPPGGHAWPPAASTISTHAAHAVPTTAVHATRLRMAPGGASSARGAREESLQASRQFAEEVLSCFHVPVSSLSSVRVTPSPFALDNNLSTNLRALLDSRLMERRGQEDGDAGSGGRLGSERGAKQQDEQRGGKGDVFGGIVSQVIGLATDFDGTVTDVTPPQKSEKENTGEAQKHEQQDYVDTCVTLFSLARQRATDPQMFDETVDEAVRVYSAGRKRILSQFSVDLAGKSVGTKSGNSTRELRQDEVGGWCACPREEAEVESEAPFSLSSTSSPTAALAAVRDVQFNAIKQLDAYEEKMANTPLTRIILRGIRRDTFDTDLLHATNAIDLVKPTALETIFRLRASDVPVTFISHSWSAHLVAATLRHALAQTLEACLSSMGETSEQGGAEREARRKGEEELSRTWAENVVQSMTFHANELVYDERGVSTGLVEPRCVTLEAKRKYARESREEGLQILRRRLMSSGDSAGAQARNAADEGRGRERENFWLIFVGDTHGDILALLEADIGILIGDPRKNMEAILYHTGVVLRPLSWLVENFRQQFKQHEEREAALCASSPSRCPLARAAGQAERERRSQFFFRLPAPQAPCCCPSPFSFSFFASSEDGPHESRCRVLYVAQNWGEIYELLFGAAPPEKGTSAV